MAHWTRKEDEAIISDYFEMMGAELRGEPFNKAEHNRGLQKLLGRTHGSIERKHQNISAILIELGCAYVTGYKPLPNYQNVLRDVVVERLNASKALRDLLRTVADAPVRGIPIPVDILSIRVDPPRREQARAPQGGAAHVRESQRVPPAVDYIEREQRNRSLGAAGEELVLNYEHKRLWTAGKKRLADRVERVSATRGDYLGYDVHSFEESGEDRLIEVKTTRSGALQPFFVTRNEVRVSETRREEYHLYRVHRFDADPQFFVLDGALPEVCELDGVAFEARVK